MIVSPQQLLHGILAFSRSLHHTEHPSYTQLFSGLLPSADPATADTEGKGWTRGACCTRFPGPELSSALGHGSLDHVSGMPFSIPSRIPLICSQPHGRWSCSAGHTCVLFYCWKGWPDLSGHLSPAPVSLNAGSRFLSTVAGLPQSLLVCLGRKVCRSHP